MAKQAKPAAAGKKIRVTLVKGITATKYRSEEHTSELQSR